MLGFEDNRSTNLLNKAPHQPEAVPLALISRRKARTRIDDSKCCNVAIIFHRGAHRDIYRSLEAREHEIAVVSQIVPDRWLSGDKGPPLR
jgi:hypothetical protein